MSKVIDYKIVSSNGDIKIQNKVKHLLDEGWELYGTPFKNSHGNYNQAMILKEKKIPFYPGPG